VPIDAPIVAAYPALPAVAQIVRSSKERAELVKKAPVHRAVLQQSHGSGIAVGENRLRAIGRSRRFP
jgi:hypothetical protein